MVEKVGDVAVAVRVGVPGELGSFAHEAALALVGGEMLVSGYPSANGLFHGLESGRLDAAVLPIENSVSGSIHENYDGLRAHRTPIVGETEVALRYALVGRPGASLASIRRVLATPAVLEHCRAFFEEHPRLEAVVAYETPGGPPPALGDGPVSQAALLPPLGAQLSRGRVLLPDVVDDPGHATRYLLLAMRAREGGNSTKTSVVFTLKNDPGSLHQALGAFASRGLDLAKIESRPLRGRPWEYCFYLDVLGDPRGDVAKALDELAVLAVELRVLGSYPDGIRARTAVPGVVA